MKKSALNAICRAFSAPRKAMRKANKSKAAKFVFGAMWTKPRKKRYRD